MKYRNLKLSFEIENTEFTALSISLEKMVTPIPRHSHSKNSYELHYVSFGYGKLITDELTYDVVPGTFFVTGPGVFHEQISLPENPMTEYGVYLQVRADDAGTAPKKKTIQAESAGTSSKEKLIPAESAGTSSKEKLILAENTGTSSKEKLILAESAGTSSKEKLIQTFLERKFWIGEAAPGMHELMKQIIGELEQRELGYELLLPALLQQLILMISRQYYRQELLQGEGTVAPAFEMPADQTYLIIEEAFLYNYKDLTLQKLASMVNLGVRQTERLLLKHYNKTFVQKKTEARMSAACLLLQDPSVSIASVATSLGYSSPEHFSNAFQKLYHVSPSAYRRQTAT